MVDPVPLVRAARQAPSGDNCQPFRFRWDGTTLSVVHEPQRAHHVLDAGHHGSVLTLGMIAESVALQAQAQGLRASLTPTLSGRAGGVWLEVTFAPSPPWRDPLLDGLYARHTDRRLFLGGELGDPVLARCRAESTGATSVQVAAPDAPGLRPWLRAADAALWQAPKVTDDALLWVRFDPDDLQQRGDGVSWRNLGLPAPLAAGVALTRALPWTLRLGAKLGGPTLTGALLDQQLRSSAALVGVTTAGDSLHDLWTAGRTALRVWLQLTLAGWGVQPMSLGVILALAARDDTLTPDIPRSLGDDALALLPELRRALGTSPDQWPAFLLRVGRSAPLDARLRPPRRPLADVFERVGAAT